MRKFLSCQFGTAFLGLVAIIISLLCLTLWKRDEELINMAVGHHAAIESSNQHVEQNKELPTYRHERMETYVKNMAIVRKALIPPPKNVKTDTAKLTGPKQFFSQLKQDRWVAEKIFPSKYNGKFIEAGALDGISISNTRHFELYYNWTGLLIEPDPAQFSKLRKAGRNAWLLHGCIGSDPLRIETLKMKPGPGGGFITSLTGVFNNPSYTNNELVTVNCYPLNLILDAIGWTEIDYWSLDVEGAEPAILQAVDFDRFRFSLIEIECASCGPYLSPKLNMQQTPAMVMRFFVKHFMWLKGYKEVGAVHHDVMYRPMNASDPLP